MEQCSLTPLPPVFFQNSSKLMTLIFFVKRKKSWDISFFFSLNNFFLFFSLFTSLLLDLIIFLFFPYSYIYCFFFMLTPSLHPFFCLSHVPLHSLYIPFSFYFLCHLLFYVPLFLTLWLLLSLYSKSLFLSHV